MVVTEVLGQLSVERGLKYVPREMVQQPLGPTRLTPCCFAYARRRSTRSFRSTISPTITESITPSSNNSLASTTAISSQINPDSHTPSF